MAYFSQDDQGKHKENIQKHNFVKAEIPGFNQVYAAGSPQAADSFKDFVHEENDCSRKPADIR